MEMTTNIGIHEWKNYKFNVTYVFNKSEDPLPYSVRVPTKFNVWKLNLVHTIKSNF